MTNAEQLFMDHIASYDLRVDCLMAGELNSKIILIGEYPGEQECTFKRPFVGGSGKILSTALRNVGISVDDCYRTNIIKRRVTAQTPVSNLEYTLWKEALEYELSLLTDATTIVVLGNTPMQALLNFDGVMKYRGSVYQYNGINTVVLNNPALVLRMPETEIIFNMDIARVKQVYLGDYKLIPIKEIINPTFAEAMQYMADIKNIHKRFAIDIEVIGGETACIGLAYKPDEAMCINFRDNDKNTFNVIEEFQILKTFADLCDDESTTVIAQNGNFDSYFMGYKDHLRFQIDFDTLLAHHTLYPRLPHNLGFLTSQYTNHPYYKDESDQYKEDGNIDTHWRYNCKDAATTFAVAIEEERELKEQNLYDFFINHVMFIHPNLTEATVTGVRVDIERKEQLKQELQIELDRSLNDFVSSVRTATGDSSYIINPSSPKQLAKLFFDDFQCKAVSRSTAAPIRENWLKDPRINDDIKTVINKLGAYLVEQKFYSTYANVKLDEDNRFRSEWKQFGTTSAPGRLSSAQTLWGSGGNSQNFPKRAYEMYMPDEGCVFIYFDLSQAEARYVGWDADIEKWKSDFERARLTGDYDAHRALAADMYKIPYEEVPRDDEDEDGNHTIRWTAKRCRHGLNYRMHIDRLAQTTGMTRMQAASNYYVYHRTNPQLQNWWRVLEREVKKTRMLFNSLGRRLFITERLEGDALDAIVAFRPQSTIGDKVARVWAQCHADDRWDKTRARIAINVHDALWGIATPDFAETALSIMKAYAEQPIMVTSIITKKTEPLIIPADLKISDTSNGKLLTMANMKKVKLDAAKL